MSFVYFIGPRDWTVGRVKIGVTQANPMMRLASFQTGSPYQLEIYAYARGNRWVEQMLHKAFAPLRLHGEWFDMDHRLLALVSDLYGQNFGKVAHSPLNFQAALRGLFEGSPHPAVYPVKEWEASMRDRPLKRYLAGTT